MFDGGELLESSSIQTRDINEKTESIMRLVIPAVQEMLMRKPLLSRSPPDELFSAPAKLPELPAKVRQKMVRLLARLLNEHLLHRGTVAGAEVGND
jgi:hypothetical protein